MQRTMTGAEYLNTLNDYILPSFYLLFEGRVDQAVFQHDNAAPHRYGAVVDWLREQNFLTMEWPPYSPDINPIENVWAIMKRSLKYNLPNDLASLELFLHNTWNNLSVHMAQNLVDSMRGRCQSVICNRGLRV